MATKLNRSQRRHQERQRRNAAAARQSTPPSQPSGPASSPSRPSPADNLDLLERFDGFSALRNGLRRVARERDEWAGIPMPLAGERLVVEPRYPHAQELMAMGGDTEDAEEDDGHSLINQWYCASQRCDILVIRKPDGGITWGKLPAFHSLGFALRTMGCSEAWGFEQESNAVQTLGAMLRHRQFKAYMLTGMFLETSKRSGVTYLFRKLRPTVAIVTKGNSTRILCALCMHPIAHYRESWAGAMTPTDDVIAHLALMRGDEAMFWRRSTQHPSWRPEAGL